MEGEPLNEGMNVVAAGPDIWAARSARAFVRALVEARRGGPAPLSFRALARAAGFGSPNYVQTWLDGQRNLKPGNIDALATALGLGVSEREHFALLVRFEQAEDEQLQAQALREVVEHAARHRRIDPLEHARFTYFSAWYVPVVHAMASLVDFRPDPNWIAARIAPPIRPAEARSALRTLHTLGIFVTDEGGFRITTPRLASDDRVQSALIRHWLQQRIRAADQAMDLFAPGERTTPAFLATVPSELVPELHRRVDAFRQELFAWLMDSQAGTKGIDGEVFQFSAQLFPVTRSDGDADEN